MVVTREELASRVRTLLAAHGLEQKQLARLLGIDASALSKSLSGYRAFKTFEVATIADALGVQVSALLDNEPVARPSMRLAARTQPGSNPALTDALQRAETIISVSDLVGSDDVALVQDWPVDSNLTAWAQGEALARSAWAAIDRTEPLPAKLSDLASEVEDSFNVDVALEPLPRGLDGLSIAAHSTRLALVSTYTAAPRCRWTLAHELGHLIAGDSQALLVDENLFGSTSHDETRANAFAAAFLMPEFLLRELVGKSQLDLDLVQELLTVFEVSLDALAFRLHNVGLVRASGRDMIRSMWPELSLTRSEDASQRQGRRLPIRLVRRAVLAYNRGDLGVRPLAALFDIDAEEFLTLLRPDEEEAAVLNEGLESSAVA